jgi:hypothetical protein
MSTAATTILDRVLEPVGAALGPETARRIIGLRPDAEAQRRIDELADRANEGTLTQDERGEYEALIAAATVVRLLQAKARAVLAGSNGT